MSFSSRICKRSFCFFNDFRVIFQKIGRSVQPRRDVSLSFARDGRASDTLRLGAPVGRFLSFFFGGRQRLCAVFATTAAGQGRAAAERPPVHHPPSEPPFDPEKHKNATVGVRTAFEPFMLLYGIVL